METKIISNSKNEIEVEVKNITLAEILRAYLNKDSSVSLAVWKRNHPTKKPVLLVKAKGKTGKKAIKDAVSAITKDLDKLDKDFSKLK